MFPGVINKKKKYLKKMHDEKLETMKSVWNVTELIA